MTHAPVRSSLVHTDAPTLRLEGASDAELSEWQRRLDRYLYACGCTSGAVALLAALAVLAAAQFDFGSGWRTAGVWVAFALGAALVGKTAGLAWAQVQRRRLYAEIDLSINR